MVEISFLADHPEVSSVLARWFRDQWPDYYVGHSSSALLIVGVFSTHLRLDALTHHS